MSKVSCALLALVAVPLLASSARADSPAYAAAKANLADGANILVGINVGSITGSDTFKKMWPAMLMKMGADAKEGLELAKTACSIDAMSAIGDIVVAADKNTEQAGAVFVSLKGIDQAKIESCTAAIAKAKKKEKEAPSFKKEGDFTAVTDPVKKETKYYKWIGKDVIAISFKGDKESLTKWTSGKGAFAKSTLGGLAGKANSGAAVFGAASVGTAIQPGMEVKSGFGWMTLGGGSINGELHANMSDAAAAKAASDKANQQIAMMKGQKGMPPAIANVLGAIKVTNAAAEIVVKGAVKESDLAAFAQMAGM